MWSAQWGVCGPEVPLQDMGAEPEGGRRAQRV